MIMAFWMKTNISSPSPWRILPSWGTTQIFNWCYYSQGRCQFNSSSSAMPLSSFKKPFQTIFGHNSWLTINNIPCSSTKKFVCSKCNTVTLLKDLFRDKAVERDLKVVKFPCINRHCTWKGNSYDFRVSSYGDMHVTWHHKEYPHATTSTGSPRQLWLCNGDLP